MTVSFEDAAFGCDKMLRLSDPSGNGAVQTLKVHIPAGIEDGKNIRLKGKGNPGFNGGLAGDLFLKVNITSKNGFERKGMDVYTTVRVPFTTAVLGGEAKVETLHGNVLCKINPGTQSGTKIRLRGKGIVSMKEQTTAPKRRPVAEAEADGMIEGRNAVIEALRAGTAIDKIYLAKGETDKTLGHIASKARAAGVVVVEADRRKLDAMSRTHAHQGVIALAAVREYVTVESILQTAADRGEPPLLVICDEISDPHNLGAILRTAECAGAHGVIIPKRRSAGLTAIVAKTSAGAVSYMPVARVANIPSLLKDLKKQGVWVFGTDGNTTLYNADLKGPAAIVIGSEGDGMTRLVAENCDFLVSIPMKGQISSLNASAAAAILLYEAVRQRS